MPRWPCPVRVVLLVAHLTRQCSGLLRQCGWHVHCEQKEVRFDRCKSITPEVRKEKVHKRLMEREMKKYELP